MNVLIFILTLASHQPLDQIYQTYALKPVEILNFQSPHTLFTSMFMHAGVFHLLPNMLYLWVFGDNVEEAFGRLGFIVFYFICGVMGSITHSFCWAESAVPSLGASGAISGVLGAYLYPNVNIKSFAIGYIIDLPAWFYLGIWIVMQTLSSFIFMRIGGPGIAWWAHVSGFFVGLTLTYFFKRKLKH